MEEDTIDDRKRGGELKADDEFDRPRRIQRVDTKNETKFNSLSKECFPKNLDSSLVPAGIIRIIHYSALLKDV